MPSAPIPSASPVVWVHAVVLHPPRPPGGWYVRLEETTAEPEHPPPRPDGVVLAADQVHLRVDQTALDHPDGLRWWSLADVVTTHRQVDLPHWWIAQALYDLPCSTAAVVTGPHSCLAALRPPGHGPGESPGPLGLVEIDHHSGTALPPAAYASVLDALLIHRHAHPAAGIDLLSGIPGELTLSTPAGTTLLALHTHPWG